MWQRRHVCLVATRSFFEVVRISVDVLGASAHKCAHTLWPSPCASAILSRETEHGRWTIDCCTNLVIISPWRIESWSHFALALHLHQVNMSPYWRLWHVVLIRCRSHGSGDYRIRWSWLWLSFFASLGCASRFVYMLFWPYFVGHQNTTHQRATSRSFRLLSNLGYSKSIDMFPLVLVVIMKRLIGILTCCSHFFNKLQ